MSMTCALPRPAVRLLQPSLAAGPTAFSPTDSWRGERETGLARPLYTIRSLPPGVAGPVLQPVLLQGGASRPCQPPPVALPPGGKGLLLLPLLLAN